jgi:hypothetical protein
MVPVTRPTFPNISWSITVGTIFHQKNAPPVTTGRAVGTSRGRRQRLGLGVATGDAAGLAEGDALGLAEALTVGAVGVFRGGPPGLPKSSARGTATTPTRTVSTKLTAPHSRSRKDRFTEGRF